jgi:hypothetical protein
MRLRHLTALGAWILVACGDTPRTGGGQGAPASAPQTASDAPGAGPTSAPGRQGTTAIEIVAVVGGKQLETAGTGECQHAAEGSIYERPASLWTAQYDGGDAGAIRHLNLTFWREQSGAESFNLALGSGTDVYRIATVPGGELHGRGTVRLEAGAGAGSLVVEGTAGDGTPVQLRVRCERFTPLVAEGG